MKNPSESRLKDVLLAVLPITPLLVFGGVVIATYPVIFWNDGVDRLAHSEDFLVWRWLPFLQSFLVAAQAVTREPAFARCVLLGLACVAALLGGRFAQRPFGRFAGFLAAALIATQGMHATLATIPYQEALFAATLFATFLTFHSWWSQPKTRGLELPKLPLLLASTAAVLTRYEGWILVPLIGLATILRVRHFGLRMTLGATGFALGLSGGFVIAAWLLFGPMELLPREQGVTAQWTASKIFSDLLTFGRRVASTLGPVISALSALGVAITLMRREHRTANLFPLVYATLIFLLSGVIDPLPAPRQPYVIVIVLLPYAAGALAILASLIPRIPRLLRLALPILLVAILARHGLLEAWTRIATANRQPAPRAATEAASTLAALAHPWNRIEVADSDTALQMTIQGRFDRMAIHVVNAEASSPPVAKGWIAVVRFEGAEIPGNPHLDARLAQLETARSPARTLSMKTDQGVTVTIKVFNFE